MGAAVQRPRRSGGHGRRRSRPGCAPGGRRAGGGRRRAGVSLAKEARAGARVALVLGARSQPARRRAAHACASKASPTAAPPAPPPPGPSQTWALVSAFESAHALDAAALRLDGYPERRRELVAAAHHLAAGLGGGAAAQLWHAGERGGPVVQPASPAAAAGGDRRFAGPWQPVPQPHARSSAPCTAVAASWVPHHHHHHHHHHLPPSSSCRPAGPLCLRRVQASAGRPAGRRLPGSGGGAGGRAAGTASAGGPAEPRGARAEQLVVTEPHDPRAGSMHTPAACAGSTCWCCHRRLPA